MLHIKRKILTKLCVIRFQIFFRFYKKITKLDESVFYFLIGPFGPPLKRPAAASTCVFGRKCYRRNPHHFREYSHAHLMDLFQKYKGKIPPDSAMEKFEAGAQVVSEQYKVFVEVCKPQLLKRERANASGSESLKKGSSSMEGKKGKKLLLCDILKTINTNYFLNAL